MSDQTIQLPKIISRKWLDERGACREQAQLFARVWPDGVAVTREALEQSAKKGLILEWLALRVLPRSDYADYQAQRDTLFADYQAQIGTLYAAYQAQRDTLYADYQAQIGMLESASQAQRDILFAAYQAQRDTPGAAYQAQIGTLEAAYRAQRDTLLINAMCNLYGSDAPAIGEGATCNARR